MYGTDIGLCLPSVRNGIISFKREKLALGAEYYVLVKFTGSYTEVNLDKCSCVSRPEKGLIH